MGLDIVVSESQNISRRDQAEWATVPGTAIGESAFNYMCNSPGAGRVSSFPPDVTQKQ